MKFKITFKFNKYLYESFTFITLHSYERFPSLFDLKVRKEIYLLSSVPQTESCHVTRSLTQTKQKDLIENEDAGENIFVHVFCLEAHNISKVDSKTGLRQQGQAHFTCSHASMHSLW